MQQRMVGWVEMEARTSNFLVGSLLAARIAAVLSSRVLADKDNCAPAVLLPSFNAPSTQEVLPPPFLSTRMLLTGAGGGRRLAARCELGALHPATFTLGATRWLCHIPCLSGGNDSNKLYLLLLNGLGTWRGQCMAPEAKATR